MRQAHAASLDTQLAAEAATGTELGSLLEAALGYTRALEDEVAVLRAAAEAAAAGHGAALDCARAEAAHAAAQAESAAGRQALLDHTRRAHRSPAGDVCSPAVSTCRTSTGGSARWHVAASTQHR